MWNNTMTILFSETQLYASKQRYFPMSLLSLFVCPAEIMFSGWGEGPSATRVFTCFHLNPRSSVNTAKIPQQNQMTALLSWTSSGWTLYWFSPSKDIQFSCAACTTWCYPSDWVGTAVAGVIHCCYTSMTEGAGGVEGDFEGQARGGKWDIGSISAG